MFYNNLKWKVDLSSCDAFSETSRMFLKIILATSSSFALTSSASEISTPSVCLIQLATVCLSQTLAKSL